MEAIEGESDRRENTQQRKNQPGPNPHEGFDLGFDRRLHAGRQRGGGEFTEGLGDGVVGGIVGFLSEFGGAFVKRFGDSILGDRPFDLSEIGGDRRGWLKRGDEF